MFRPATCNVKTYRLTYEGNRVQKTKQKTETMKLTTSKAMKKQTVNKCVREKKTRTKH